MKTYQAMFIFSSSLAEDAIRDIQQTIQSEIEKLGGKVTATEAMGKRVFARPLKKMDTGYYTKMVVAMEPASVHPLLARLKLSEKIFRVQIVELKASAAKAPAPAEAGSVANA